MHILTMLFCLLTAWATAPIEGPGDPTIGPGDVVDIQVHRHNLGAQDLMVGIGGEVSFPYVGMIKIGGLNVFEAEQVIREALMKGYLVDPQVTVRVKSYRSQNIDVIGAVKSPGVYSLDGPTTVRALIAKAGGAVLDRTTGFIFITRDGVTTELALDTLDGPGGDFLLAGGDIVDIDVGRSVYLTGEIVKPGPMAYSPGLTISEAIIKGGGGSRYSLLSRTYIVRDEERIRVNVKRIIKGKASDLQLAPGDRIVVPQSAL